MGASDLLCEVDPPVFRLYVAESFNLLSDHEKYYAHLLSRIVSPELETLFEIFTLLRRQCECEWEQLANATGTEEHVLTRFLEFAAAFLDSLGNYRGHGDSKILPRLTREEFRQICSYSRQVYSESPSSLGFPDSGALSQYYPNSPNIISILLDNTRLKKQVDSGQTRFQVLTASVSRTPLARKITTLLVDIDGERATESSVLWIKNRSPVIKSNIGFIEAYRDPSGNKDKTATLATLARNADVFVRRLPWSQLFLAAQGEVGVSTSRTGKYGPYKNDDFKSPDFVSLNLLTFVGPLCWSGIAGRNYRDVTESYSKKNIFFANRTAALVIQKDQFNSLRKPCFWVMIAAHELIGHGCGKELRVSRDQGANFDDESPPPHPITQRPITTWYKNDETPKTRFGGLYATLSECHAELVAMHLLASRELLDIMQVFERHPTIDLETFEYNGYLNMITLGLRALLSYNQEKQKWGQSHDPRFAIVKHLVEAGDGLLNIEVKLSRDGKADLVIHLDKTKIPSCGRKAVAALLLQLHLYKFTADVEPGQRQLEDLTRVDGVYSTWLEAVVARRQPRPLFVQANTIIQDGNVELVEYTATVRGVIQSWVDRSDYLSGAEI
ncbi:peptidase family M49-domain-containing protein [Lophiotrema nucula]|uniref:Peptidase family M49-domain-containing protein n=1 Tax=Lophiotrema nucula TaxID=690887 RepID=A0A6A5ZRX4_9PLEO|nr:peptidase family M49-domain-containing protein [Lophiotrema nucula]